jgi:hypothetical protein
MQEKIEKLPASSIIHVQDDVYILKFHSGITYHGEVRDRMRNGFGTQTWPDKAVYSGNWINNEPNGRAKFTHPSGDFYEG